MRAFFKLAVLSWVACHLNGGWSRSELGLLRRRMLSALGSRGHVHGFVVATCIAPRSESNVGGFTHPKIFNFQGLQGSCHWQAVLRESVSCGVCSGSFVNAEEPKAQRLHYNGFRYAESVSTCQACGS